MILIASCTVDAAIAAAKTGNTSDSSNLSGTCSFVDVSKYLRGHPKKGIFFGVSICRASVIRTAADKVYISPILSRDDSRGISRCCEVSPQVWENLFFISASFYKSVSIPTTQKLHRTGDKVQTPFDPSSTSKKASWQDHARF